MCVGIADKNVDMYPTIICSSARLFPVLAKNQQSEMQSRFKSQFVAGEALFRAVIIFERENVLGSATVAP